MSEKIKLPAEGEAYFIKTPDGYRLKVLSRRGGVLYGSHPQRGDVELKEEQERENVMSFIASELAIGNTLEKEVIACTGSHGSASD